MGSCPSWQYEDVRVAHAPKMFHGGAYTGWRLAHIDLRYALCQQKNAHEWK